MEKAAVVAVRALMNEWILSSFQNTNVESFRLKRTDQARTDFENNLVPAARCRLFWPLFSECSERSTRNKMLFCERSPERRGVLRGAQVSHAQVVFVGWFFAALWVGALFS